MTFSISERRACGLMSVWRSSCRYQHQPDRNGKLREQLVELAQQRPRFGYRRLGVLLSRESQHVNHKRLFRVYREAGLSVKRNRRKKLVRIGVSRPVLTAPNDERSLDFDCDALANGRTVRVLSIVDNFTRECLALEVDTSFASQRVTRALDTVIARRGLPKALRMDTGALQGVNNLSDVGNVTTALQSLKLTGASALTIASSTTGSAATATSLQGTGPLRIVGGTNAAMLFNPAARRTL